jgi:hypothetical protein
MTLKETLLQELETADDAVITAAIDWLRSHKDNASLCDRSPNHPLRSLPIAIPADFDEPMLDLWEATEQ